jgi:hypothetical protein
VPILDELYSDLRLSTLAKFSIDGSLGVVDCDFALYCNAGYFLLADLHRPSPTAGDGLEYLVLDFSVFHSRPLRIE